MARFYVVVVDWRLAEPICLFWVMIATASFMGLPVGTLVLETLAGLYVGRRYRHAGIPADGFPRRTRKASLLVALVTGMASLGIGILALRETYILAAIQKIAGTDPGAATMVLAGGMVLVLCLLLVALQYWCTRAAAARSFRSSKPI
ncbi:MAG: hypothetical protein HXY20_01100 [Acidobacteria bacterium]|nr:hypothetical protein [Acidobacteriota bacterium]